jgi:hypothetical protein
MVRPPFIERAAPAEASREREAHQKHLPIQSCGRGRSDKRVAAALVAQAIVICHVSHEALEMNRLQLITFIRNLRPASIKCAHFARPDDPCVR